jgi:hypothetical protein
MLKQGAMIHYIIGDDFESPYVITEGNVEDVIDKKMKSLSTTTSMVMMAFDEFDEDLKNAIFNSDLTSKSTNKKSGTDKGDKIDPFGKGDDDTPSKSKSKEIGQTEKEKKLKAFVEAARNVPAIAREQEVTMQELSSEFWGDMDITKEFFFSAYNSSPGWKERIDAIFNLCEDDNYLVSNYLDKLV